jgi:hypothetical protein
MYVTPTQIMILNNDKLQGFSNFTANETYCEVCLIYSQLINIFSKKQNNENNMKYLGCLDRISKMRE